ncbi:hypothetical protein P389DRAFT_198278 [Cystobasidium minutum MCA 4210]|uniref:uncharacterized protein n=1 Tax=Cystobasidium minutum MCA 4210 TaxID=1397322 RepID=UPI0034CD21A7|eukprot:jgi/Rhomi1/198278/gm1.6492_g
MAPIPDWPAPYLENIDDNEEVYSSLVLVTGRAGPVDTHFDGQIIVDSRPQAGNAYQAQAWPVTDSYFKALVPLDPGANNVTFTFVPPSEWQQHAGSSSSLEKKNSTSITVTYQPLAQNPPLHLVILAASDSPLTIDCPPERRGHQDTYDALVAKFQLWAYMCQAFTAEQCRRNDLGRRPFALEEYDGPDNIESYPAKIKRRRPYVHFIRSTHSLQEFRSRDCAQQCKNAKRAGAMHEFATEALNHPSAPPCFRNPNGAYVAVLTIDAHWDPTQKLLLAHAALGAGGPVSPGNKIGVFGSHSCWSWPRSLPEVVPAFLDCTDVDERHVVNDLGNIGTAWETLNVGHGAFIHEVGHALNLPHHKTGIMARGYHEWNRAFMTNEARSKRCNTSGCRPITPKIDDKENHWNRMSLLRLRYHPCLRLPRDPYIPYAYTRIAPSFAVVKDGLSVKAPVGLGSLELQVDDRYVSHIGFPFYGQNNGPPPQDYLLTTSHIAELIGADPTKKKVTLTAVGTDQRQAELQDYSELSRTSRMIINVSEEGPAAPIPTASASSLFKKSLSKFGGKHSHAHAGNGHASAAASSSSGPKTLEVIKGISVGSEKPQNPSFQVVLNSVKGHRPRLIKVEIVSGFALDGFKLYWEDGSKQVIGPCKGGGSRTFKVDPPIWEGGETGLCGGGGGDIRVLEPPPGSEICGMFGTYGAWMDSLGLLYTA